MRLGADRRALEDLKISLFTDGLAVSPTVRAAGGDDDPLTLHEYATTGGLTLVLDDDMYVNAPFDDWYEGRASAVFDIDGERYVIVHGDRVFQVQRWLPLPGYRGAVDGEGRSPLLVAHSHADRVRLSPIRGCAYDCHFCDLPGERYQRFPIDHILAALELALADEALPVSHGLISGGSPGRAHYNYFEDVCRAVFEHSPIPFDIMMSARENDADFMRRMVDAGVHGFSLNIEASQEMIGPADTIRFLPAKARFTRPWYEETLTAAVEATGGHGRVRSLIILGLEPLEASMAGVRWLAERGVDPVLSPFRPARNTKLAERPAQSADDLRTALSEARAIVAGFPGVELGPRCIPCQHNTLSFPWDVTDERLSRSTRR